MSVPEKELWRYSGDAMCPSQKHRRHRSVLLTLAMAPGRLLRKKKQTQMATETDYLFSSGFGTVEQGQTLFVGISKWTHQRSWNILRRRTGNTGWRKSEDANGARENISTGHTGLYEKYGYEFFKTEKDVSGEDSRIYCKKAFTKMAAEAGLQRRRLCLSENTAGIRFYTHTIS